MPLIVLVGLAAFAVLHSIASVDPALASQQPGLLAAFDTKLTAGDRAASDEFGRAIALSDTTVVVGAPRDDSPLTDAGSAYVFVQSGASWVQQAKLTASDAAANDNFGIAVAIDGNYAVVGANLDRSGTITAAGSAYVYVRSGTSWVQQTRLFASDAAASDQFGSAVAISGNRILVGAPKDDLASGTDAGSAYVFVRLGTTWSMQAKLTASDAATSDGFGGSVALSGGTAVVGASADDHGAGGDAGSTYVFVASGTVWTQEAKLTASDAAATDLFGVSVAVSGNTALIGASHDDHSGGTDAGAAYVYVRSGVVWGEEAKLVAANAAAGDHFGVVALDGDRAVIGAPLADVGPLAAAGSAYAFARSGTMWTQSGPEWTAADAAANDQLGAGVALAGALAAVSAPLHDPAGFLNAGAAYVDLIEFVEEVPGSEVAGLAILALLILATAVLRLHSAKIS